MSSTRFPGLPGSACIQGSGEATGMSYSQLVERLVDLALENAAEERLLRTSL